MSFWLILHCQTFQVALLTGSDYTEGIDSVGPVTAMEILAEFAKQRSVEGADEKEDEDAIATLRDFKQWWDR